MSAANPSALSCWERAAAKRQWVRSQDVKKTLKDIKLYHIFYIYMCFYWILIIFCQFLAEIVGILAVDGELCVMACAFIGFTEHIAYVAVIFIILQGIGSA